MALLIKHKVFDFYNNEYEQIYVQVILYRVSKENSELLVRVMYYDTEDNARKSTQYFHDQQRKRVGRIEPKVLEDCGCQAINYISLPYNFYYELSEMIDVEIEGHMVQRKKFDINIVGNNIYEFSYNKLKESFKQILPLAEIIDV